MITFYTIGFTKKSAEQFFTLLQSHPIAQLVDVRISNSSQLAGFAKGRDLEYFVQELCHVPYVHLTALAPTKELLDNWHRQEVTWSQYEQVYIQMLDERRILGRYAAEDFDNACFLCSEETPEFCHRRLLAEYLQKSSSEKVRIVHL